MRGRTCMPLIAAPRSNRRCRASVTSQGLASAMSQYPANAMRQRLLDRNQRFRDSQQQHLDAPHWVRPQDRMSVQGQAGARPHGGPPPACRCWPPPGGVPARVPGAGECAALARHVERQSGRCGVTPASGRWDPPLREPSARPTAMGPSRRWCTAGGAGSRAEHATGHATGATWKRCRG